MKQLRFLSLVLLGYSTIATPSIKAPSSLSSSSPSTTINDISFDGRTLKNLGTYEFKSLAELENVLAMFKSNWSKIQELTIDIHMIVERLRPGKYYSEQDYSSQLPSILKKEYFPMLVKLAVTTHEYNIEATLEQIANNLPQLKILTFTLQNPPFERGFRRFQCCTEEEDTGKYKHNRAALRAEPQLPKNFTPDYLSHLEEIYFVNFSNSKLCERLALFHSLKILAIPHNIYPKFFTKDTFPQLEKFFTLRSTQSNIITALKNALPDLKIIYID
jgi:hypothetical protein